MGRRASVEGSLPDFSREERLWQRGLSVVAGVDEVGRGPLAGPVVAAAVVFTPQAGVPNGLNDSKKLTARQRLALYEALTSGGCRSWAHAVVDAGEIDRINILRAAHRAMAAALAGLGEPPAFVLVDGLPVPTLGFPHEAIVGGDSVSASVAAASVIAKVHRDALMDEADRQFPGYGFARHKGYATKEHLAKLREHGPCPIHRRSFSPVAQLAFGF